MSLLSVKNLSIDFHSREGIFQAVKNISFHVNECELLGIVGESGSGKSISCQSLVGLLPTPPADVQIDDIQFNNNSLKGLSEKELQVYRGSQISFIFQDPMTCLNPYMSVGKQLIETLIRHTKTSKRDAMAAAVNALNEVGIINAKDRIHAFPHEFSGGMRQRVMIAMALIAQPKLLIADEPTTALDVTVQAQILTLLRNLQKKRKLAIIFITHDLGVISQIADRVIVMKSGTIVEEGQTEALLKSPQHAYTLKLINSIPSTSKSDHYPIKPAQTQRLEAKGIEVQYSLPKKSFSFFKPTEKFTAVNKVDLTLNKGEIVGLVGESGSGKSTLGRTLIRLIAPNKGEITLEGEAFGNPEKPLPRHLRRDIQMIFQDPYASLNPRKTIYQTLAEPLLIHGIAKDESLSKRVNKLLNEVGLGSDAAKKYPHQFSGGQRQRIAIARAIAIEPKLIIADEPVSALDVTVQAQILTLFLDLTEKYQLSMLFISHDLSVVRYLCDRVMVMKQGSIVEKGPTEVVFNSPQQSYTQQLIEAIPQLPNIKRTSITERSSTPHNKNRTNRMHFAPKKSEKKEGPKASQLK